MTEQNTVKETEQSKLLKKTFFGFFKVVNNKYILPITEKQAFSIKMASEETAEKIINCEAFQQFFNPDGTSYWGIVLPKKYSLTNEETLQLQGSLSTEALADYYELRAELIEDGVKDDEVDALISNPNNYKKLKPKQRIKAFKFLKEFTSSQDQTRSNITGIFSSRVIPDWTLQDTNVLPESIINELSLFINNEKNQWESEEEDDSPKQEGLITIDGKPAT